MSSPAPLLEAEAVSKRFGSVQVLKRVSLSFSRGERVLLLGANGAGKSTLLRILSGLSRADSGAVSRPSNARIGFVSHHLFLYGRLTVRENLKLFASEVGPDAVNAALEQWGLSAYANRQVAELSKGNQVKVSIVRALLPRPSILLFDEPSSNLDEQATALFRTAVLEMSLDAHKAPLCITATHDIHRLAALGTRVIVLKDGGVVSDSGPGASEARVAELVELYRESNR